MPSGGGFRLDQGAIARFMSRNYLKMCVFYHQRSLSVYFAFLLSLYTIMQQNSSVTNMYSH